jgi:hypothetical protein
MSENNPTTNGEVTGSSPTVLEEASSESLNLIDVLQTTDEEVEASDKAANDIISTYQSSDVPLKEEFSTDSLLFVSGKPNEIPGSLYFSGGLRIRLMHALGPMVSSEPTGYEQFCLNPHGEDLYDKLSFPWNFTHLWDQASNNMPDDEEELSEFLEDKIDLIIENTGKFTRPNEEGNGPLLAAVEERVEQIRKQILEPLEIKKRLRAFLFPASLEAKGKLVEFSETAVHRSRNGPLSGKDLKQSQINILLKAAETGDNDIVRACFAKMR